MTSVAKYIRTNGGGLPLAVLAAAGIDRGAIDAALQRAEIVRVRRAWYAVPDTPSEVVRAVRVGGTATAATVARLHGLWVNDDLLHVRVRHSTGRLAAPHDRGVPLDRERHSVCVHYSTRGGLDRGRDPLTTALAEMFACSDSEAGLAAIDSALERSVLDLGHLDLIRAKMPPSRRRLLDRVDPASQSGIETKVRLLLRSRRIAHRSQANIAGVGHVDVLVGERLVIEVDGRAFHTGDAFNEDRRRDFELVTQGYLVLRLSYGQVVGEWERTKAGILALVARGEHRWSGRGPFSRIPGAGAETSA